MEENNKNGTKFDNEKNLVQLLPVIAMERIAQIFTFGAKKYSQWNWAKGIEYSRIYGALLRHLFAWYRGEKIDSESGQSHLYHAGCCIMMLIEMEELRPDMDDRPVHYQDKKEKKMIELHYKCTTWCKLKFPENIDKNEIIKQLNEGELPLDIAYNNNPNFEVEWETINDTEEFMTVKENNGNSTIELMEEQKGKIGLQCIWDNSYESENKRF